MAIHKFTRMISQGDEIPVYHMGESQRDYTYVDDIVDGIVRVMDQPAAANPEWDSADPDPGTSSAPYRLYNIGNNSPVMLLDYIAAVEKALGKKADMEMLPMQPGDVAATCADIDALEQAVGYRPNTPIEEGVNNFISWYLEYSCK